MLYSLWPFLSSNNVILSFLVFNFVFKATSKVLGLFSLFLRLLFFFLGDQNHSTEFPLVMETRQNLLLFRKKKAEKQPTLSTLQNTEALFLKALIKFIQFNLSLNIKDVKKFPPSPIIFLWPQKKIFLILLKTSFQKLRSLLMNATKDRIQN